MRVTKCNEKKEREGRKQRKTGERCKQVGENMREETNATEARCTVVVPADGGVGVSGWE